MPSLPRARARRRARSTKRTALRDCCVIEPSACSICAIMKTHLTLFCLIRAYAIIITDGNRRRGLNDQFRAKASRVWALLKFSLLTEETSYINSISIHGLDPPLRPYRPMPSRPR